MKKIVLETESICHLDSINLGKPIFLKQNNAIIGMLVFGVRGWYIQFTTTENDDTYSNRGDCITAYIKRGFEFVTE